IFTRCKKTYLHSTRPSGNAIRCTGSNSSLNCSLSGHCSPGEGDNGTKVEDRQYYYNLLSKPEYPLFERVASVKSSVDFAGLRKPVTQVFRIYFLPFQYLA